MAKLTTEELLDKAVSRGRMTADKAAATLALVTATTDYEALKGVDLVVEGIGEGVAMATMRRSHPVGGAKVRADPDSGRLFTDVEMQEAWGFALAAGDLGHAFEAAQQRHAFEQVEQDSSVGQIWRTLEILAGARRSNCHQSLPGSVWRRAKTCRRRACGCSLQLHNRL